MSADKYTVGSVEVIIVPSQRGLEARAHISYGSPTTTGKGRTRTEAARALAFKLREIAAEIEVLAALKFRDDPTPCVMCDAGDPVIEHDSVGRRVHAIGNGPATVTCQSDRHLPERKLG